MSIPLQPSRQKVWLSSTDIHREYGVPYSAISAWYNTASPVVPRKKHAVINSGPTLFHRDDVVNGLINLYDWKMITP